MSYPSLTPENAAPVAPVRQALSDTAQPIAEPLSPSLQSAGLGPLPPREGHGQGPGQAQATAAAAPVSHHTAEVLGPAKVPLPLVTDHADQNKKPRGPTLLHRSPGPSLLTQALATARGIPPLPPAAVAPTEPLPQAHNISNSSSSSNRNSNSNSSSSSSSSSNNNHHNHDDAQWSPQPHSSDSRSDSGQGADTGPSALHHEFASLSDAGSVAPRSSPTPNRAMAPSATVSASTATTTTMSPPPPADDFLANSTYNLLDLGGVDSMLRGHRGLLKSRARGSSLERLDQDRRAMEPPKRAGTFSGTVDVPAGLPSPRSDIPPSPLHRAEFDDAGIRDFREQHGSARKADHRLSMGPEKIWSIGTGELGRSGQDGQVEKSITEVLAGVEPNARSRKASHSLRFFREGLPEDKSRRRDTRVSTHLREKLSGEAITGEDSSAIVDDVHVVKSSRSPRIIDDQKTPYSSQLNRERTYSIRSPDAPPMSESPQDYFTLKNADVGAAGLTPPVQDGHVHASETQQLESGAASPPAETTALEQENGQRLKSDDSTEVGESAEDGDDSGEEKISSAVFLPHQGLEEPVQVSAPPPGTLQRATPGSRTLSRVEDFHPWLVKADEPENDDQTPDEQEFAAIPAQSRELAPAAVHDESLTGPVEDYAIVKNPEQDLYSPQSSRSLSHYYEEHVHEHQSKQPLEAIELIPYKHQVGGHTTLWRFSKRAVCKQLNNRENEFYERIERYHRDLLPFLPRYIGVLNVTFHKQPRRRSTVKRDEMTSQERPQIDQDTSLAVFKSEEAAGAAEGALPKPDGHLLPPNGHERVISQSLQSMQGPVPTVTFVDNQHILPRYLLQPSQKASSLPGRFRSSSATQPDSPAGSNTANGTESEGRPGLEERHANSWGATMVNKKLRNEVFNDAFLKQPIAVQKHRKAHQRALPRRTLQHILRPASSDSSLLASQESDERKSSDSHRGANPAHPAAPRTPVMGPTQSDLGPIMAPYELDVDQNVKDVTGTSAPEPQIMGDRSPGQKKKRRYSGSSLRRKPRDVRQSRGDLIYVEEADDAGYKGDNEDGTVVLSPKKNSPPDSGFEVNGQHLSRPAAQQLVLSNVPSTATSGAPSPTAEFKRIPRPINPKEAQTQRDSRVEYFLLLEDLTAGMKRPCIMDLKMGTRQYGVDANPKKQKSQQRKCAQTTSRQLGVRVCGLQVWDAKTQSYVFKDKYYGRSIKAGQEFQDALTSFLYDGVDHASILRHIPTILQKLSQLEIIVSRLKDYRFYAASLLMFYDGDASSADGNHNMNDTAIDDSTTDFATDTEAEPNGQRRSRRNRHEIDFKMADFANSVTAGDLAMRDKPCPPQHPNEPDVGFLKGLRSLRRYFLKIQRDTRLQLGIPTQPRGMNGLVEPVEDADPELFGDDGATSE